MERFEEAVPLYLTACTVEGKTDRTVQSYAGRCASSGALGESLACRRMWQLSGRPTSICSWAGCGSAA